MSIMLLNQNHSHSLGNLDKIMGFNRISTDQAPKCHRSTSVFYPVEKNIKQFDEFDNPLNKKLSVSEENLFSTMKHEINRLNTFIGKWPLTYVKPEHLAGNGFFYLQSEDKVQCAFCHVIVDDWNVGQKPLKEHIKNSPRCPFILSSNVGNVPIVQPKPVSRVSTVGNAALNSSNYKPKNPRMSSLQERLGTYKYWPLIMLSTQQLAECGFYYTGVSCKDEVTCFFCGGSLGNWELNDDPWVEHTKFFPHCAYLSLVRRHNNGMQRQNSAPVHQVPVIPQPVTHQPGAKSMEHEYIKEACNIFPKSVVEKVVLLHLKETGRHYASLTDLCEAVLEYSDKQTTTRVAHDVTGFTNNIEQNTCEMKSLSPEPPVNINGENTSTDEDETQQPIKSPRDYLLCKICMDREMGMVFQPCGHLVACPKCAQVIYTCPLCRTPVTGKVRTYLG